MVFNRIFPIVVVIGATALFVWASLDVRSVIDWFVPPSAPSITSPVSPTTPPVPLPRPAPRITGDFVQLGSYRTAKEAQAALNTFARFSDIFDVSKLTYYSSTLPSGVWYRIVVPVKNRSTANDLCTKIKARGGDCLALTIN